MLCWRSAGRSGGSSWSRNSLVRAEPGLSAFPAGCVRDCWILPDYVLFPQFLAGLKPLKAISVLQRSLALGRCRFSK